MTRKVGCWEFLEIEPTEELAVIKKAYARKLKFCHPEDDPTGYQALREAYEEAQRLVKQGIRMHYDYVSHSMAVPDTDVEESIQFVEEDEIGFEFVPSFVSEITPPNAYEEAIAEVMTELEEIYTAPMKRIELSSWQAWLTSEIFWDLNLQNRLFYEVTAFIEQHPFLMRDVWQLLDQQFHWQEMKEKLDQSFDSDFVEFLLCHVNPGLSLIKPLWRNEENHFDQYFHTIESIYIANRDSDLHEVESMIESAMKHWGKDYNLMLLLGDLKLKQGSPKWTLDIYKELRIALPNDVEMRIVMGKTLIRHNLFKDALIVLKEALKIDPKHVDGLVLSAECTACVGNIENAYKLYIKAAEQSPHNPSVLSFGRRLFKGFEKKMKKKVLLKKYAAILEQLSVYAELSFDKAAYSGRNLLKMQAINLFKFVLRTSIYLIVGTILLLVTIGLHFIGVAIAYVVGKNLYEKYKQNLSNFDK